jgi:hypothetical protein
MQGTLLGKVDVGNASFPPVFFPPHGLQPGFKKKLKKVCTESDSVAFSPRQQRQNEQLTP